MSDQEVYETIEKFEKENADLISDFNKMQEKYNETQEKYTTTETEIKKGRKGYVKITLPKEEK